MKPAFILILVFIIGNLTFGQSKVENDIEFAFQNAKKGVYWAFENIPEKKIKIENNLIADDKLYSFVKVTKVVNGIKIESTGYHNTNEVMIKIFRSNESLEEEGYLKKKNQENSTKSGKKKE